jgi:hypothetical protein
MLLRSLASFVRRPTTARLWIPLAAAGATGLIRPTVCFYGTGTAIVALAIWLARGPAVASCASMTSPAAPRGHAIEDLARSVR